MTALGDFTAGDVLQAADLNAIGTWTSYTPTWTASGGTPSLGNGSLTAKYIKINNLVIVKMFLVWGSTTSAAGTTEWRFSYPVAPSGTVIFEQLGSALVHDATFGYYSGVSMYVSSTTFGAIANVSGNTVGSSVPMTWTTNDKLSVLLTYETA